MAEENKYYDLLYAYAIGCLDTEENIELENYLNSGDEYPWQELGEYQNLVALLPSILEIETPGEKLKDAVALKLYKINSAKSSRKETSSVNLKKEKEPNYTGEQAAISEETHEDGEENLFSSSPAIPDNAAEIKTEENIKLPVAANENTVNEDHYKTQIAGREGNIAGLKKSASLNGEKGKDESKAVKTTTEQGRLLREKILREAEKEEKKNKSLLLYLMLILFLCGTVGFAYIYLKASTQLKTYKGQVENLNKEITSYTSRLRENQTIFNILHAKDVKVVNMTPSALNPGGFGKVVLSFDNSRGFLQLSQTPILPESQTYQLWVSVKGKFVSLGLFNPTRETNYYPFSLPQLQSYGTTVFILTREPASGSDKPGSVRILTGILK